MSAEKKEYKWQVKQGGTVPVDAMGISHAMSKAFYEVLPCFNYVKETPETPLVVTAVTPPKHNNLLPHPTLCLSCSLDYRAKWRGV
eukprot:m.6766 g.6766  ORF g.6766 m.6766 type:complete len:86 (+) comp5188_c0_seq2:85-342(+)